MTANTPPAKTAESITGTTAGTTSGSTAGNTIGPWQSLSVEIDNERIAHVSLNQPEKRNALSARMIDELTQLSECLKADREVIAVVLCGNGPVFCAGGDLAWMKEQIDADRATRIREASKLARMLQALNTIPQPLISLVHGGAYGGGAGLCCISDVAIASTDAKFGFTETRLGLIPATIGPYVLARLGEGMARRVFMSSRVFDADEALRLGLVAKVVPEEDLPRALSAELAPYTNTVPDAVAAAKALARSLGPVIDEAVIRHSVERLADTWESEATATAIDRFLNKAGRTEKSGKAGRNT